MESERDISSSFFTLEKDMHSYRSVRPEGWEKLTLNRCNFSHFLSIITPVKVEFLTLYVNNYTN